MAPPRIKKKKKKKNEKMPQTTLLIGLILVGKQTTVLEVRITCWQPVSKILFAHTSGQQQLSSNLWLGRLKAREAKDHTSAILLLVFFFFLALSSQSPSLLRVSCRMLKKFKFSWHYKFEDFFDDQMTQKKDTKQSQTSAGWCHSRSFPGLYDPSLGSMFSFWWWYNTKLSSWSHHIITDNN